MITSHPFNLAEYDFDSGVQPDKFYAICSTERSGSNYLSSRLWQTGLCGAPQESFNYYTIMFQLAQRMNARNIQEYVEALFRHRTSANGVFGFKAHWGQFLFLSRLSDMLPRFQPLRYLFIDRKDVLAQAVSFAIARQTDQWTHLLEPVREPVYDRRQIARCLREIKAQNAHWQRWFEEARATPYRVGYEAFCADPDRTVERILQFLEIEQRHGIPPFTAPPAERQSDPRKAEWVARYQEESQQRPVG